jgi:hypothetical protein
MKPMCYLRLRDGKPDWSEDCISEDGTGILDHECYKDKCDHNYAALPLYAIPKGWQLVPINPTDGMLRAFIECPEDELRLAYEAMLRVTLHTVAVVDMDGELRALPSGGGNER